MNGSEETEEEAAFDGMVLMPSFFALLCMGTSGHKR